MIDKSSLRYILAKNTGIQALSHAVSLLAGLFTAGVLSRYLGIDGFGQYNYIFAFFYFFAALTDLGISSIAVREIASKHESSEKVLGGVLALKLLLALVSMGIAVLIITALNYPPSLKNALLLYTLIFPITALQSVGLFFQTQLNFKFPVAVSIVSKLLNVALLLLAVRFRGSLTQLIGVLLITETFTALLLLWRTFHHLHFSLNWDTSLWKRLLRPGFLVAGSGILSAVISRIDFIMLERITDLKQVGYYAAAYRFPSLLELLPVMLMSTLFPVMSQHRDNLPYLKSIYHKSLFFLTSLAIPMGIAVTFLAPWMVRLVFGPGFEPSARALQWLIWQSVFLYLAISGGTLLISTGHEKFNLGILAVAAGVNIFLNFLWIPQYGFIGAAVSTVIASFVNAVGIFWAVRKVSKDADFHG